MNLRKTGCKWLFRVSSPWSLSISVAYLEQDALSAKQNCKQSTVSLLISARDISVGLLIWNTLFQCVLKAGAFCCVFLQSEIKGPSQSQSNIEQSYLELVVVWYFKRCMILPDTRLYIVSWMPFNAPSEEEIGIVFELKGAVCLFNSYITTSNCIPFTRSWLLLLLPC